MWPRFTFAFSPRCTAFSRSASSLSFSLELNHVILCCRELLVGQVVVTEEAAGKLHLPMFAGRSLLKNTFCKRHVMIVAVSPERNPVSFCRGVRLRLSTLYVSAFGQEDDSDHTRMV